MKTRRILVLLALFTALSAAGFGLWRVSTGRTARMLATAPVRRGEFLVIVRCRGELKARNTVQITAPNVPDLRVVWLAPAGSPVKTGDPVVRFDPSSARQQLQENQAALEQAEASVVQAEAEARLMNEQDKRERADAAYEVERAKLEVSKAEIVSRLQGEESRLDLGLAEEKLAVKVAKLEFNQASNAAKVASMARLRDKAKADVEIWKRRLERMELKAPIAGVLNFLSNYSQGWMNAKPFKVGDQVWPGGVIAEIPALETIELEGKIEEIDRGQIAVDQKVLVRIDSLPEVTFSGKLVQFSPMTEMGFEWPPTRNFKAYASIDKPDRRLRPGMNGKMDVVLRRIPNALSVPAKAVYTRDGKPIVYSPKDGLYAALNVEVEARNPDEVAIKGIPEGTQVTLSEPEKK
jgi:multidrug efflux pump subunit AcrA (membrane-fusion protein)